MQPNDSGLDEEQYFDNYGNYGGNDYSYAEHSSLTLQCSPAHTPFHQPQVSNHMKHYEDYYKRHYKYNNK